MPTLLKFPLSIADSIFSPRLRLMLSARDVSSTRQPRHFIYACHAMIPSSYAHSVQVANMASEFARLYPHAEAILRVPWQKLGRCREAFATYGVRAPASFKAVPSFRCLDWTAFYLGYFAALLWRSPKDSVVYTRTLGVAKIAAFLRRETVLELHNPLSSRQIRSIRMILNRQTPFRMVVTTARLKEEVVRTFGLAQRDVLVAGGGANERMLKVPARTLGSKYRFNAGYAGSAFKGKGVEVILKCAERMPWVGFHIIGPSEEECRRFGELAPNVKVYGRRSNLECASILKSMDCLLLPNQKHVYIQDGTDIGQQTSPLKKFEYMAVGKPIIASDIPVLREVLKDGVNCLLCKAEDIDGFCDRITELYEQPTLATRLGETAREEFRLNYSWRLRARNILRFLSINAGR